MPTIGRLRLLGSTLFLSTLGRRVSGSFGSLSEMMVAHNAPPQSAMRTVALPPSVSQLPVGSAANTGRAARRAARETGRAQEDHGGRAFMEGRSAECMIPKTLPRT